MKNRNEIIYTEKKTNKMSENKKQRNILKKNLECLFCESAENHFSVQLFFSISPIAHFVSEFFHL